MPITRPIYRSSRSNSEVQPVRVSTGRNSSGNIDSKPYDVQWGKLNPHLIAKIFPVDNDGKRIDGKEVHAPIAEGAEIEMTANWVSPFESSGADSVIPSVAAMMQSGAIQPLVSTFEGAMEKYTPEGVSDWVKENITNPATDSLNDLQNKTGMTKLNSTQIFTGSMPVRITLSLIFRAYKDAMEEVERPNNQLWQWALPQHLQKEGAIAGAGRHDSFISAAFPSVTPQLVGMTYKGHTYAPLVIESISKPIDSPITEHGDHTSLLVPVMMSSMTALDKNDWIGTTTRI